MFVFSLSKFGVQQVALYHDQPKLWIQRQSRKLTCPLRLADAAVLPHQFDTTGFLLVDSKTVQKSKNTFPKSPLNSRLGGAAIDGGEIIRSNTSSSHNAQRPDLRRVKRQNTSDNIADFQHTRAKIVSK